MKYSALICFCILISVQLSAQRLNQIRNQERTTISFGGQIGVPQGEFREVFNGNTYGIGGSFLTKTRLPFIYTGLNFTYARLDKFTDNVYLEEGQTLDGYTVFEEANVEVNHKIYRTHVSGRFEPFKGKLQPYIEGMAGMRIFSSKVKVKRGEGRNEYLLDKYALERSFSTSYGWAAGVKVQAAPGIFIEGRYAQLNGGRASYIDSQSMDMNSSGEFSYDILNSRTNTKLIHLGVAIDF